jgi:hypothetical protein
MSGPLLPEPFTAAGLPQSAITEWIESIPRATTEYIEDIGRFGDFWARARRLVGSLPAKPKRSPAESMAADAILLAARNARALSVGACRADL